MVVWDPGRQHFGAKQLHTALSTIPAPVLHTRSLPLTSHPSCPPPTHQVPNGPNDKDTRIFRGFA